MTQPLKHYARMILLEDFRLAGIPVSYEFARGTHDFCIWECIGNPGVHLHDSHAELGEFQPIRATRAQVGSLYKGDTVYQAQTTYVYEACDFPARLMADIETKLEGRDRRLLCRTSPR